MNTYETAEGIIVSQGPRHRLYTGRWLHTEVTSNTLDVIDRVTEEQESRLLQASEREQDLNLRPYSTFSATRITEKTPLHKKRKQPMVYQLFENGQGNLGYSVDSKLGHLCIENHPGNDQPAEYLQVHYGQMPHRFSYGSTLLDEPLLVESEHADTIAAAVTYVAQQANGLITLATSIDRQPLVTPMAPNPFVNKGLRGFYDFRYPKSP